MCDQGGRAEAGARGGGRACAGPGAGASAGLEALDAQVPQRVHELGGLGIVARAGVCLKLPRQRILA